MADINLNAATYEQIVTLLSQLATNYSNMAGTFYDVFYNSQPENVTFQMFDENGVLKDYTVKNLALSNEYRKTGEGNPNGKEDMNLMKGTTYQDLKVGDLYIKRTGTDTNQGWEKLINKALLDTFILHGEGDPNGNSGLGDVDLGTLYVDTVNVGLYINIGTNSWAPITTSFLEFANRDLDNLTDEGIALIEGIVTKYMGEKVNDTISITATEAYTNDQYPSALAVYNALVDLNNRKQNWSNMTSVVVDNAALYPSSKAVYGAVSELQNNKQDKNLVTVLSSESTDSQYPSAKCVYDLLGNLENEINAL